MSVEKMYQCSRCKQKFVEIIVPGVARTKLECVHGCTDSTITDITEIEKQFIESRRSASNKPKNK